MARRARSPRKEKPAKAKAKPKPKPKAKGRGRRAAAGADFEVTEQMDEGGSGSGWTLEAGLVVVTTLALLAALLLVEMEMLDAYGTTWPF